MSEEKDEMQEIEAAGPGGIKFRARGYDIITLVGIIIGVLVAYVLWQHMAESKEQSKVIVDALKQVATSQQELSYMISLTAEERARLKLDMPPSLRERLRER